MSKQVIGIHNGHNSAAALVRDGKLEFALQEERLTRIKNQGDMPTRTLAHIATNVLEAPNGFPLSVAFGGENLTRCAWRREDILRNSGLPSPGITGQIKRFARKSNGVSQAINKKKMQGFEEELKRIAALPPLHAGGVDHHLCHAASAYYGWGKLDGKVLVLTCDGAGDTICASVNVGENGQLTRIAQTDESHSIGALYSKITFLLGMVPLEHEYKLMGLAPYAEKSAAAQEQAREFEQLLEFEPNNPMAWRRKSGVPALQFSADFLSKAIYCKRFDHIAAGLQLFVERFLTAWVRQCIQETGIHRVALSGGVFMNVKLNQRILELPEVEELFVFPSCGDETNTIGSAWLRYKELYKENPRPLADFYLGNEPKDAEMERAVGSYAFRNQVSVREVADIERTTAALLSKGEIVARFKGRAEFGARALGNRSILANAASPEAIRIINEMIKCRDFWMPFAPSVLAERSEDYFVKPKGMKAPYMIITFDTRPEKRAAIPAAIHPYDHTGRPQEVTEEFNSDYYRLLKYYEEMTGEGLILNTSFNLHGEPVVSSAEDALRVFDVSGLKHLALGQFLLSKEDAPASHNVTAGDKASHISSLHPSPEAHVSSIR
jgi:carbamoyltransferase